VAQAVMVVDDETSFRLLLAEALGAEGYEVVEAGTLTRARTLVSRSMPAVMVLDRRLPDGDGIDFLEELRRSTADPPMVLVVTAYGDVESAVTALRAGAADYLVKPINLTDLLVKVGKVLESRGLRDRLDLARARSRGPDVVAPQSAAMRRVFEKVGQVAKSPETSVFLFGPSGSGKQVLAEVVHRETWGPAADDRPFVEVNCALLSDDRGDAELFGQEGAAGGAPRRGLIERANGGTLFLDEIGDLPPRVQAKLLKFCDTRRYVRVGGERELGVELRVIAATNQDVEAAIKSGQLRADLYHRLAVFRLDLPRLVDRLEDIGPLAESFVRFHAEKVRKKLGGLHPEAVVALKGYDWPGNVRELKNVVERAVILAAGPQVRPEDIVLPGPSTPGPTGPVFFTIRTEGKAEPPPIHEVERRYVARVLEHFEGKRMVAAQALGISYPTFLKRLRELEIEE
jgi:two-component system response regulator AtoC